MSRRPISTAEPTYLPVDGPPWRLVDKAGAFVKGPDGRSLVFATHADALAYRDRNLGARA